MNLFSKLAAVTAIVIGVSMPAIAAPISGDVGIGGSARINPGHKSVNVIGDVGIVLYPGGSGDLASLTAGTTVNFTDFKYGANFVPLTLWSGNGYSLFLSTLSDDTNPIGHFVDLEGDGVLSRAGYDDTPGKFTFSANIAGGNGQWRWATDTATTPISEPFTIGIMGVGLISLGMARTRRVVN